MFRHIRPAVAMMCLAVLMAAAPAAFAQRRGGHVPPHPPGHVAVRGHTVFVGGYFYDPHFGPYPWWGPGVYPYWYEPLYGTQTSLRLAVTPKEAAVYVDGFYAGIVDDFDGFFQSLPLPPGGHQITLYLPGYRTVTQHLYLSPGSTFKLELTMERLPDGSVSEPPSVAAPVPPPPADSFVPPRTPPRDQAPPMLSCPASEAAGAGSLQLRVQPANAEVTIDGERWASSQPGQFAIQLTAGSHRIEVARAGFQRFSTDVVIRERETERLNVVLSQEKR